MSADPRRALADLSDDELLAELRRALGPLPEPATVADLRRVEEQARAAYAARYGHGTAAEAQPRCCDLHDPTRRDPAGGPDSGSGGSPVPPLPGPAAVGGDVPTSPRPPTAHQRASETVQGVEGLAGPSRSLPLLHNPDRTIGDWWEREHPAPVFRGIGYGLLAVAPILAVGVVVGLWVAS